MEIVVSKWNVFKEDNGYTNIGGEYQVKAGGQTVATQGFNEGYSATKIAIPASILAKIEELDTEITIAIAKNFNEA